jgi:hypothetical protein
MRSFVQRHATEIKGVLSGFDRLRFRGTIRWLSSLRGMGTFMGTVGLLLKHFNDWAHQRTERIRWATERLAADAGRPVVYLDSSRISKEQMALEIAAADGITEGLIAVLSCVEPCHSFKVGPNREQGLLELRHGPRKCLHYYFYLFDQRLGLTYLRLQTWAPFAVHVGFNGRDWLARQLVANGIGFEQRDNCFVDVADPRRAQALLDEQLRTNWKRLLDGLLARCHPAHAKLFGSRPLDYYWSAEETEVATDVMFRSRETLRRLYPRWLRQAMTTFGSGDVLRFLGQCPQVHHYRKAEITSALRTRPEGACVKHARNRNSVKMYDKQGTVLRVETTINQARDLKVLRPKLTEPKRRKCWQQLRKGVADLHRRAKLSRQSNERYLEALATVDQSASLAETVRPLCQPARWKRRTVRGLQPLKSDDAQLLAAISRGEFHISGFRNGDLRPLLFGAAEASPAERKRQSAKITRLLRMLRAHGIIRKITKTHRYRLTPRGQTATTALAAAQQATIQALTQIAA